MRHLAALLLLAAPARAEPWRVSTSAIALTAPALGGLSPGVGVSLRREISGAFHAEFALGTTEATGANASWTLVHDHAFLTAGAGATWDVGRTRLSLDLAAGAVAIAEDARRQQFARLEHANVPDRERTAVAAGPFFTCAANAEIAFTEGWSARLSAGPTLARLAIDDIPTTRLGLLAGLGVTHAF